MAIDAYMMFTPYGKPALKAESQVDFSKNSEPLAKGLTAGNVFEIQSYAFSVDQTLNIGSQSSGAGAGKITFNPFTITRKIDSSSPIFFSMACNGTTFSNVTLALRKSGGGEASGSVFLRYDFKLVAVKDISWSGSESDEAPSENVSFEYGGMVINYNQQNADGTLLTTAFTGGWNRVKNTQLTDMNASVP